MIIYIHGFNSSAESYKAKVLHKRLKEMGCDEEVIIPSISSIPGLAIESLKSLIEKNGSKDIFLIGSSLGGYYATWLANHYDLSAVLINPAVKPYDLLQNYLGKNTNYYTGEEFELTTNHIKELKQMDVKTITRPNRYFVMLQTGDEVLDYQQALEKFTGSKMLVEECGDHSFNSFEKNLDIVLNYCGFKVKR